MQGNLASARMAPSGRGSEVVAGRTVVEAETEPAVAPDWLDSRYEALLAEALALAEALEAEVLAIEDAPWFAAVREDDFAAFGLEATGGASLRARLQIELIPGLADRRAIPPLARVELAARVLATYPHTAADLLARVQAIRGPGDGGFYYTPVSDGRHTAFHEDLEWLDDALAAAIEGGLARLRPELPPELAEPVPPQGDLAIRHAAWVAIRRGPEATTRWLAGDVEANESAAIGALRTLVTAQAMFRERDKDGDGLLAYGTVADLATAKLLDERFAAGRQRGYAFRVLFATADAWQAVAEPLVEGLTGARSLYVDQTGVIRAWTGGSATAQSAPLGGERHFFVDEEGIIRHTTDPADPRLAGGEPIGG